MANDPNELQMRLYAAQQAATQGTGAGKGICGLAMLRDVNAGAGLSPTVCGVGKNPMVQFSGTGRPNGLADKFLQAVQSARDQIAQCAQGAGAMYAGDVLNPNVTHGLAPVGRGDGPAIG